MFLLDTDTIIYNLKGHEAVKKNLQHNIDAPLKISAITLMELYYGAYKSEKFSSNIVRIRTIESTFEIIPTGKESAENFGMLKASLEKSGTRLDDFDLAIASCALAHNLTLVTNNLKHFSRIEGLKVANWSVYPEKNA
jgi:predicted nucleic acid-binding protein